MAQKIATCCYCGTRAALTLQGAVQHELACSTCGAPLHELKQMPARPQPVERKQHYEVSRRPDKRKKTKKKYKKKSKSWGEKLFDGLEEIIDIFD